MEGSLSELNGMRRSISATIEDIARLHREIGPEQKKLFSEPDDREAFDIIARIERKMRTDINR